MALTEQTKIDKIEVLDTGAILVREATIIERDGVEISRTFHRVSFDMGADLTGQPDIVQQIAALVWPSNAG